MQHAAQVKAEAGTVMGPAGTSVATDWCGHERPAKLRITLCEYWIWVETTLMFVGRLISCGGVTTNWIAGMLGCMDGADIFSGLCPGLKTGTSMVCCTVSIQKVALTFTALALAAAPPELPSKKAILAVPSSNPAWIGSVDTVKTTVFVIVCPLIASRKKLLGSSKRAWVIVPAAMNLERSCGNRGVAVFDAVWAMNLMRFGGLLPITNGVILTAGMVGGPAILPVGARPEALIVVPGGIDPIRVIVSFRTGVVVVAGTAMNNPGSK